MKKLLLTIPFALSLTACNYFSTDSVKPAKTKNENEAQKVVVYNGLGNAEQALREAAMDRGYKLNWHAKGQYNIGPQEMNAIAGLTLGEALLRLQEIYTHKNISQSQKAERNGAVLPHPLYVLAFVCADEINFIELDSVKYSEYRQKLHSENPGACRSPETVILSKEELANIKAQKAMAAQAMENVEQMKQQSQADNSVYENDDTPVDINDIDFGNMVVTQEFIQELEKDTGQKFNPELYMQNLQKRRALQAQQR